MKIVCFKACQSNFSQNSECKINYLFPNVFLSKQDSNKSRFVIFKQGCNKGPWHPGKNVEKLFGLKN